MYFPYFARFQLFKACICFSFFMTAQGELFRHTCSATMWTTEGTFVAVVRFGLQYSRVFTFFAGAHSSSLCVFFLSEWKRSTIASERTVRTSGYYCHRDSHA